MPLITPTTAYIALGANLGDREGNIRSALERLGQTSGVHVEAVSALMENEAMGGPAGSPPFLNAAARVETTLEPRPLLDRMLEIERELGRQRRERWEPRPIDLDLLLYGDRTITETGLILPHPRMHEREFVLRPLSEIAGDVVHPGTGKTIAALLEELISTSNATGLELQPEGQSEEDTSDAADEPADGSSASTAPAFPRIGGRPAKKMTVVVRTIAECRAARAKLRRKRLALVPTLGALHEGNLLCMQVASEHAPSVAVSLFVNPTQFGPREDFNKYPRPIDEDLDKCRRAGVDLVFVPSVEEMYPPDKPDISIDVPQLTSVLEGKHRPGYFKGVCQVVAKLFHIIQPNVAVFGQKDFQRLRVIGAMTEALDWPIEIVSCPTLREPDGLAMSTRNALLSPEDRRRALAIHRALSAAEAEFRQGHKQTNRLMTTMQKILLEQHLNVDYVAAVDPVTLKNVDVVDGPTVLAVAARVGNIRLIDNVIVAP